MNNINEDKHLILSYIKDEKIINKINNKLNNKLNEYKTFINAFIRI